jgi:hypothetical protein
MRSPGLQLSCELFEVIVASVASELREDAKTLTAEGLGRVFGAVAQSCICPPPQASEESPQRLQFILPQPQAAGLPDADQPSSMDHLYVELLQHAHCRVRFAANAHVPAEDMQVTEQTNFLLLDSGKMRTEVYYPNVGMDPKLALPACLRHTMQDALLREVPVVHYHDPSTLLGTRVVLQRGSIQVLLSEPAVFCTCRSFRDLAQRHRQVHIRWRIPMTTVQHVRALLRTVLHAWRSFQ